VIKIDDCFISAKAYLHKAAPATGNVGLCKMDDIKKMLPLHLILFLILKIFIDESRGYGVTNLRTCP